MSKKYQQFINEVIRSPNKLLMALQEHHISYEQYYQTLPSTVFSSIWQPIIESEGFYSALPIIKSSFGYISLENCSNQIQQDKHQEYILSLIFPHVVAYKSKGISLQEMVNRIQLVKKAWKINAKVCSSLIALIETDQQKQNGSESKKQKIISDMLLIFDKNQSKVQYQHYGFTLFSQSVGEIVFELRDQLCNYKDQYKRLLSVNREKILYIFSKIKKREIFYGSILTEITLPERNNTILSQIKNITMLFLFTESWDKFKEHDTRLKQILILQIFTEAFHRLLYLTYNNNQVTHLFFNFLLYSNFSFYDELKQTIGYHLLALHKLYTHLQNDEVVQLIQVVWREKMNGIKVQQNYLENCPKFVTKSQRCEEYERNQEQSDTKSNRSNSSKALQDRNFSRIPKKSKKSRRTILIVSLNTKIRGIQNQLRRFHPQKVLLLIQSFRNFYLNEYQQCSLAQQPPRSLVIELAVLIMKQLKAKSTFCYNCELLCKFIDLLLMEVIDCCCEKQQGFRQYVQSISLFQLCVLDQEYLNVQTLLKFHERNNFEESIQTLLCIKLIYNQLNTNSSNLRLQVIQASIEKDSFQAKVYELYKYDFSENKRIQSKKLLIIGKLLSMKSKNITNNLLTNYVYNLFRKGQPNEVIFKKKINLLSKLLNQFVLVKKDKEKIYHMLRMGIILLNFENKEREMSIKRSALDQSASNNYFYFLRRKEHALYYREYAHYYHQMNYLKESLYFLQLHNYNSKNPGEPSAEIINSALQIYSRLNVSVKNNINSIKRYQDALQQQKIDIQNFRPQLPFKSRFQLIISKLLNMMEGKSIKLNTYEYESNGIHNFETWLRIYLPSLSFYIEEITILKQSQEINQNLLRYSILVKIITFVLNSNKNVNFQLSQDAFGKLSLQIQRIKNYEQQISLYQILAHLITNKHQKTNIQNLLVSKLLRFQKYKRLQAHLTSGLKQNQINSLISTNHLIYYIKLHFQQANYAIALSKIRILMERGERLQNLAEIYHLELECKYFLMLNFTLENYMEFAIEKCIQPLKEQDNINMNAHFSYYFKIFRMLFNRYNFMSMEHNNVFLKMIYAFINKKQILTSNREYINETIFHLIKFILQKFCYLPNIRQRQHGYVKNLLTLFKDHISYFVPYCNYLIKRISSNPVKNQIIQQILKVVLSENAGQCVWLIAFLKNFDFNNQSKEYRNRFSTDQRIEYEVIKSIYMKVVDILKNRNDTNPQHQKYIDSLIRLSFQETSKKRLGVKQFGRIPIPAQLPFIFDQNYFIDKIMDMRVLSNGKSAPLEISFNLKHKQTKNCWKNQKIIIKGNTNSRMYRMESNVANFFEEINLIDSDITYKIFHLSKFLVAAQYVKNCGTVSNIIYQKNPEVNPLQQQILKELQNRRKLKDNQKRLFGLYDTIKINANLSKVIYNQCQNIRDWWIKNSNFVRTHAQWSYLGYIVGLGDRHTDNILMTEEAKIIHIDFQYALDYGLVLPVPQWVPFRLTNCFIEPLGILGVFGMFYAEMINTAKEFHEKQPNSWRALSNFIGSHDTNICQQIVRRSKFVNLQVNCLQDGIAKIINTAKDPNLLRMMYCGWRAYF